MIVIDIHEPDELKSHGNEVKDLKFDILIQGEKGVVIIERKTIWDLVHSINGKRLFLQLERLMQIKREMDIPVLPVLLIEGYKSLLFKAKKGGINKMRLLAVESTANLMGIHIIYTNDLKDTKVLLTDYDKRLGNTKNYYSTIQNVKTQYRTPRDESLGIIGSVSGIGNVSSVRALDKYKSVYSFMNETKEEYIELFGEKKGNHIYEIIHMEHEG